METKPADKDLIREYADLAKEQRSYKLSEERRSEIKKAMDAIEEALHLSHSDLLRKVKDRGYPR